MSSLLKDDPALERDGLPRGTAEHASELLHGHLNARYVVSGVISRSLDSRQTLPEVRHVLHELADLCFGMVCLVDQESGDLPVSAPHGGEAAPFETARFRPGAGVIGTILMRDQPWLVPRIKDEPQFLDRLCVYHPDLPFIGVPIRIGEAALIGVFAAQPPVGVDLLAEHARFLEMVANLIGQAVRLAHKVEAEKKTLRDECDSLRRRVKGQHGFDNIIGRSHAMQAVFEQVRQVAKWNTTVLICGESGTGPSAITDGAVRILMR